MMKSESRLKETGKKALLNECWQIGLFLIYQLWKIQRISFYYS